MKTLILLRHAKSGWDDPGLRDFDRPLNAKGQRAAALVGRNLRAMGLSFDRVLASPAVRVVETIDHAGRGYGGLYQADDGGALQPLVLADQRAPFQLGAGQNAVTVDISLLQEHAQQACVHRMDTRLACYN
jgi:hypothetical protein